MTKELSGRTVFIAGAGSGMGRALAVAAACAGARLILLSRSIKALEATAALACDSAPDSRGGILVADAADAVALTGALATVDLSTVDILVNFVGTNIAERSFDQLTPTSWAAMLECNLTAAFNLARAFVPVMRRKNDGLVINIASTAARKADRSGAAYQASKAGVVAMTHAIMEEEWQHGLRATAILPGMTDTPLLDRRPTPVPPEARAAALQPEDVAEACLFVMRLPPRAHVSEIMLQPSRR